MLWDKETCLEIKQLLCKNDSFEGVLGKNNRESKNKCD